MRNGARSTGGRAATIDDVDVGSRRGGVLAALGWSHRDAVGFLVAVFAGGAILVNVLFLQTGTHPAPMVKSSVTAAVPTAAKTTSSIELSSASLGSAPSIPRQRPAEAAKSLPEQRSPTEQRAAAPRPQAAVVMDIQRELSRRGFYDGVIDGRYGPRTDSAIRDFEQAAGLRPSTAPDEALLRAILRTPINIRQQARHAGAAAPGPNAAPTPPARIDPIAELLTPTKRVVAVQRALTEFGYGQIEPTGLVDPETQVAIEKFERQRRLPVTGQVSDRLARELASLTGRPIE